MIFRTDKENEVSFFKNEQFNHQFENYDEWIDENKKLNLGEYEYRIDMPSWQYRYDYEANILEKIISDNNFKNIIELGSGPGELGQKIINKHNKELNYTFIDQLGAEKIFLERKFKGKFLVKNLMNDFDISDLKIYDFIITNDFLEHIYNPSIILQNCYKILEDNGKIFISVPNWRMGHTFIYRGLFDFDNFMYFSYTHGFEICNIYKSPLTCPYSPKESYESSMDDQLITSWNWYLLFNKRK